MADIELRFRATGGQSDPLNLRLVFGATTTPGGRVPLASGVGAAWGAAADQVLPAGLPYDALQGSQSVAADVVLPWGPRQTLSADVAAPAGAASRTEAAALVPWGNLISVATLARVPWGVALEPRSDVQVSSGVPAPVLRAWSAPWGVALDMHRALQARWGLRPSLTPSRRVPWGLATGLDSGGSPYAPPPRPPLPGEPGSGSATQVLLRLCKLGPKNPLALRLVLGVPCTPLGATEIPPQRYYMSTHTLAVVRLPDNLPLDLFAFRLDADRGSFCWSFSAEGPAELMALLAPAAGLPVTIKITLDSMVWHFLVERLTEGQTHEQRRVRVSGRSVPALVGADYSPQQTWTNPDARNAQQLAAEALDGTGVTLDWEGVDWLVPPGAWSFIGGPLQAVLRLAEAGGGYVQSHRSQSVLHVRPPYPVLPWNWGTATPEVLIAPDAIVRQDWARADKPAYNGVYVSGESQGVLAHVKRTGTAGAVLAPMVTDALVTGVQAARQRGESVLGPTGAVTDVQIEIPVLVGPTLPGVVDVGTLVEITGPNPWRGLVRGVSVASAWPTVRQTLTIERHL